MTVFLTLTASALLVSCLFFFLRQYLLFVISASWGAVFLIAAIILKFLEAFS